MDAAHSNLADQSRHSTSRLAGETAALASGSRRAAILTILRSNGPLAIFEIARLMHCHDHQISGRFGEMERDGLLVKTGERRTKPNTKCDAEVYTISAEQVTPPSAADALVEQLGYPPTLKVGDEGIYNRSPITQGDPPGVPYVSTSGLGQVYRIEIIECPGCGRPLKFIVKGQYTCSTPGCNRTWYPTLVNESGKSPVLALVMKHL